MLDKVFNKILYIFLSVKYGIWFILFYYKYTPSPKSVLFLMDVKKLAIKKNARVTIILQSKVKNS